MSRISTAVRRRVSDDRGLLGGADILLFGIIAFVVTGLVIINIWNAVDSALVVSCLLYTSPSPRDATLSRMPSSA